jgi:Ca2+-binding RTX toxin-like protein
MSKPNRQNLSAEFVAAAGQISDAVDAGASPGDPTVIALLNSLVAQFNPTTTIGTDLSNILFSRGDSLNYVNGLGGDDTLIGRSRTDVLAGGAGNDHLFGFKGNDGLFGGAGHDTLYGGHGRDVVRGGTGDDRLFGGAGNDTMTGGIGNDVISGGRGNDVLTGGDGADRFIFNPDRSHEGHDRITDFALGTDKIVLKVADVLASTPGLLGLSGDPTAFEPTDLDVSSLWTLSASADGDLVVGHPTGSIELDGIKFDASLTFGAILPAIELV